MGIAELLDRYLLEGTAKKADVIAALLHERAKYPHAAAFFTGIESLGVRAPDLSLIALRLVLAGKKADDGAVVRMRHAIERVRAKGVDVVSAREQYFAELAP